MQSTQRFLNLSALKKERNVFAWGVLKSFYQTGKVTGSAGLVKSLKDAQKLTFTRITTIRLI